MTPKYPIIIIGMHRSGTTLITSLLEELGLFVGTEKDVNNESLMFIRLNNWLLSQGAATWDNPSGFRRFLEREELVGLATRHLEEVLSSKYVLSYMGEKNWHKFGGVHNLPLAWGWKDPRNTFTLPVWQRIFPNARIIHVVRNGIDVAQSLRVREQKRLKRVERKWSEGKYKVKYRRGKSIELRNLGCSVRCAELSGALDLWEEYLMEGLANVENPGNTSISIRYEDFLESPSRILTELGHFCGLIADETHIDRLTKKVNSSRSNAYREDIDLVNFAEQNEDRLSPYGY